MKQTLRFGVLMVMASVLTACGALPASHEDMDRLGSRLERAIVRANYASDSMSMVMAPAAPAPTNFYDRTETVTEVKGEQLPDGSGIGDTTIKRLRVDGDLSFGAYDKLLRQPDESLLRLPAVRGGSRSQPQYFTAPAARQPTMEEVRRLMPGQSHQPCRDGR